MGQSTLRQIRGLKDLLQEAVEAATIAIEDAQRSIARRPYALLSSVDAIAAPALAVEQAQQVLTGVVYASIRAVNQAAGAAATCVLDHLEEQAAHAARLKYHHRFMTTDWRLPTANARSSHPEGTRSPVGGNEHVV